jgi:hypothetical protein
MCSPSSKTIAKKEPENAIDIGIYQPIIKAFARRSSMSE